MDSLFKAASPASIQLNSMFAFWGIHVGAPFPTFGNPDTQNTDLAA